MEVAESDRAASWRGPVNHFFTPTYSDEHMPKDRSVSVRELQLFHKRLRNRLGAFRMMCCGEYSEPPFLRPHYHGLYFKLEIPDLRLWSKSKSGGDLYRSEIVETCWGKGFVWIGALTLKTSEYVAGYTLKKVTGDRAAGAYQRVNPETGETWQVKPEFAIASRRPGIGSEWFQRFGRDAFPSDFLVVEGRKVPVPRYYLDKLPEAEREAVKAARRAKGLGTFGIRELARPVTFAELRGLLRRAREREWSFHGERVPWSALPREDQRVRLGRLVRRVVGVRVGRNAARAVVEGSDARLLTKHEIGQLKQARIRRDGAG